MALYEVKKDPEIIELYEIVGINNKIVNEDYVVVILEDGREAIFNKYEDLEIGDFVKIPNLYCIKRDKVEKCCKKVEE